MRRVFRGGVGRFFKWFMILGIMRFVRRFVCRLGLNKLDVFLSDEMGEIFKARSVFPF